MNEPCPQCSTPMVGVMLVDGIDRAGEPFGEARAYCVPCEEARFAYRDHPFCAAYRKARLERMVSMRVVAAQLGTTVAWVSQVEAGMRPPPASRRELAGWAWTLGMEADELQALIERESVGTDRDAFKRGAGAHGK